MRFSADQERTVTTSHEAEFDSRKSGSPVGPISRRTHTRSVAFETRSDALARARESLFRGCRVLIDASFKEERRRLAFVDVARDWGVPVRILECVSPPNLVRKRLARRTKDPSDADWSIYEHVRATWEPFGPRTDELHDTIDTSGSPAESTANALAALAACELANPS